MGAALSLASGNNFKASLPAQGTTKVHRLHGRALNVCGCTRCRLDEQCGVERKRVDAYLYYTCEAQRGKESVSGRKAATSDHYIRRQPGSVFCWTA